MRIDFKGQILTPTEMSAEMEIKPLYFPEKIVFE